MNEKTINENYDDALKSLKQINNEMFYDNLKERLEKNLKNYEESYSENVKKVKDMETIINRLPMQLENQSKEFSARLINNSNQKLEETSGRLNELYSEQIDGYNVILKTGIQSFQKLGLAFENVYNAFNTGVTSFIKKDEELLKSYQLWIKNSELTLKEHRKELDIQINAQLKQNEAFLSKNYESIYELLKEERSKLTVSLEEMIKIFTLEIVKESEKIVDALNEIYSKLREVIEDNFNKTEVNLTNLNETTNNNISEFKFDVKNQIDNLEKSINEKFEYHRLINDKKSKLIQRMGIGILILQIIIAISQIMR